MVDEPATQEVGICNGCSFVGVDIGRLLRFSRFARNCTAGFLCKGAPADESEGGGVSFGGVSSLSGAVVDEGDGRGIEGGERASPEARAFFFFLDSSSLLLLTIFFLRLPRLNSSSPTFFFL